jgi:hypothetical protein
MYMLTQARWAEWERDPGASPGDPSPTPPTLPASACTSPFPGACDGPAPGLGKEMGAAERAHFGWKSGGCSLSVNDSRLQNRYINLDS